ncbi:AsmA family protein [Maridesulfovibrio frigidus]|uniref:AsmA family protein n=1 Tax=Maridesulfovibrio frigidus TaxID=340956 RepID=UPI0004E1F1BD|nr:AsmA family protein [Maridesulfovibrio frigidus]
MFIFKALRVLLITFLGLVAFVIVSVGAILFFEIPIDATILKPSLEQVSSYALGRKVTFGGELKFVTSLSPAIEVADITIANPPGYSGQNFAALKYARLHLNAYKLLFAKLEIHEITIEGIRLNLESKADGAVNWDIEVKGTGAKAKAAADPKPDETAPRLRPQLTSDSFSIDKILLKDIQVTSISPTKTAEFRIDECTGSGEVGEPFNLNFVGNFDKHPYKIGVKIGSLAEFLASQKGWAEINVDIAKTQLTLTGDLQLPAETGFANLSVSVQGENINTLNSLLKVDLPPFKNYGIVCNLNARHGKASLQKLDVHVGASRLIGNGTMTNFFASKSDKNAKLGISAQLTAELIQLDDFNLDGWSPTSGSEKSIQTNSTQTNSTSAKVDVEIDQSKEVKQLLSPEFMNSLNADFKFEAREVKKGETSLGRGLLVIGLKNGVLSIDPLDLHIPGGSAHFDGIFTITKAGVEAGFKTNINQFDYGVIARSSHPDTKMGGLISLDVAVESKTPNFNSIMENANGYFRIGAKPEDMESGIIDLWAVNLFTAVMDNVSKEKSKINCALLRLDITDGIMTSETIMADTSKMRIFGKSSIDFKKRTIDLEVAPKPKRPEFFSLATPVAVHGTFKDFGIGVSGLDLVGTVVSFIVSPVVVPFERIFTKDLPTDGSDVCDIDFATQKSPVEFHSNGTVKDKEK